MIRTTLHPPSPHLGLSLEVMRAILKEGRATLAQTRRASRAKALRYTLLARSRAYARGYQEGLQAATSDCRAAIAALAACHSDAQREAVLTGERLARQLATHIIDTALIAHPEIVAAWIQQALAQLAQSQVLRIDCNPRYKPVLDTISASLPHGVLLTTDPHVASIEFRVETTSGCIEFEWRDAITHLIPLPPVPSATHEQ